MPATSFASLAAAILLDFISPKSLSLLMIIDECTYLDVLPGICRATRWRHDTGKAPRSRCRIQETQTCYRVQGDASMTFTIGIISDTHGVLRPEALRMLAHVDHIIHGGDIGDPKIITALRRIAPVTAIRGNVDTGAWATRFAETESVQLAGHLFYVLHDLNTLQIDPVAEGIDVIVSGHSHVPKINTANGLLYVNPGSAGRRRFNLPITVASLEVTPDGLEPIIHDLEVG